MMKVFYSMGDGMRQSLKMEELNRLVLFIPSETEQQKIVDYLDRQTARIDTLIAEQNRLIELLAEQRKAVISHAVTSGINPNATMKKSGVEWLGDVPSHWEIKRLKYVSNINLQTLPENTDKNAVIQYVDIGSVSLEKGIEKVEKFIFGEAPSRARRMAKTGDIVVSTVRTYLKAIATVTDEFKDCIFSTGFAVVSSKGNINSRYLTNCLKSDSFTNQVTFYSKGLSYPAINSSDLSNLYIAIPPLSEQNEIVAYIEKQTAQIDALIAEQNRLIDRLTQYRASLISAAVTGKIDVQAA
ncbi:type I restriction modification DNA specificity domain protein [Pasteurella bettyae CCUG 2042]|uniref:Type I restriction modification DNA specificity domain protein n=1 Tax=Pasteurella bettyae CCUG 2042 TaxID=1095749 RepID=I3D9V3_9PAST|nr:type I restriction modification DNA specificity domain protein [Pasteurella bettyae CCUG 2042]